MRTIVFLAVTFLAHIAAAADQIFPLEAANHVEEQSTVCGVVVSAKYAISTRGSPTFLNLDKPYPNHIFTALIWGVDRPKFTFPPENLEGNCICVSGLINLYKDKPQIIVADPAQIVAFDQKCIRP